MRRRSTRSSSDFAAFALVACKPRTGRTHQIRIHLTHIGHPILADKLYSGRDRITLGDILGPEQRRAMSFTPENDVTLIDRQALHAHSLQFRHPLTNEELKLDRAAAVGFSTNPGCAQEVPASLRRKAELDKAILIFASR